jgi:hypothetical protein
LNRNASLNPLFLSIMNFWNKTNKIDIITLHEDGGCSWLFFWGERGCGEWMVNLLYKLIWISYSKVR